MAKAKVESKTEKKTRKVYEAPVHEQVNAADECQEYCEEECCRCGEPLTRYFTTYEGFRYLFKYGAAQEYCGNEEQKYSVIMIPEWGRDESRPQCICVKKPMVTGSEIDNRCFIDLEVGFNYFPLSTLDMFTNNEFGGTINGGRSFLEHCISVCLNIYRRELGKLDIGYDILQGHMNLAITEPVNNGWGKDCFDMEGRFIVTVEVPRHDSLANDNIIFVTLGMEFIRQIMATANEYIYLVKNALFKPKFIDLFARNIRHEIANDYYPNGFDEVLQVIAYLQGCDGCEGETKN